MPRSVSCPVCRSDVKVPREAEPGAVLTCTGCDERFTPPQLKKKGYDPDEEDAYELGDDRDEEDESVEQVEKRRKTKSIREAGRQYRAELHARKRKPLFGPTDLALLILAVAASLGSIAGFIAAKKVPTIGQGVVIVIAFCGLLGIFAYRHLMRRR